MALARPVDTEEDLDDLLDAAPRFWNCVDKGAAEECWEWTGGRMSAGYGELRFRGRKIGAHRFSYLLPVGDPEAARVICHACVNPGQGTYKDNFEDVKRRFHGVPDVLHGFDESFWTLVLGY